MASSQRSKLAASSTFIFNLLIRLARLATLVVILALIYFAYRYSLHNILHGSFVLGLLFLWALAAYTTLPRVHRLLSKIYLPDYYMGRARTSDGLLGDPINVAVLGSARQLRRTMLAAGWIEADRPTFRSTLRIIHAVIFRKSYPAAPGSTLYLFGYRQAYSFQKQIGDNPRNRHHVRFWKTPGDWWLPGGFTADWLGAVHYDTHVGLSLFTGQFTHKIGEHIDEERDLLVADITSSGATARVEVVPHFTSGFHARNGGGDRIRTDGAMPFVDLRQSS
ncbi:MAG TPA: LssY C-terminal domain-containing protein [Candidatus Saccharimonadales bacterium]|nr:LssY C-terminal domain-containing protein [Candidatus Saccharimonadales bacterium]